MLGNLVLVTDFRQIHLITIENGIVVNLKSKGVGIISTMNMIKKLNVLLVMTIH